MLQPAPVQSVYIRYLLPAQNGMLASEVNWAADSRNVETAAGIGFGLAVSQGVADAGCIIGGSAFVGITRADITLARADITPPLTVDVYPQYAVAGILVMGDLWVIPDNAVVAGEAVYYSSTTGKLGHSGGTVIEDARWMTSAAAGGLAVVRLGNIAGNK
jgi:hypothetical protein